jgi:hypothetical protein
MRVARRFTWQAQSDLRETAQTEQADVGVGSSESTFSEERGLEQAEQLTETKKVETDTVRKMKE